MCILSELCVKKTGGIFKKNSILGQGGLKVIPFNKNLKEKARKLRRNMTLAEKNIWSQLFAKDNLNGLRFLRQKPIDEYIVDFYCH